MASVSQLSEAETLFGIMNYLERGRKIIWNDFYGNFSKMSLVGVSQLSGKNYFE